MSRAYLIKDIRFVILHGRALILTTYTPEATGWLFKSVPSQMTEYRPAILTPCSNVLITLPLPEYIVTAIGPERVNE